MDEWEVPENWNYKSPSDLSEKSEGIFYDDNKKFQIELRFNEEEQYWYVKSIRSEDTASSIDGKEFQDYYDALEEVFSRIEDAKNKGTIPREYLIHNKTGEIKTVIKAFDEFSAAAKFLTSNSRENSAIVKDANQFGDETLTQEMDVIKKRQRDISRNNIYVEIVKEL